MIEANTIPSSRDKASYGVNSKETSRRAASGSLRRASVAAAALLGVAIGMIAESGQAAGTWVKITTAPPGGLDNVMLMTDGTLLCGNGGSTWYKYKPDANGSYTSGTWSTMASTTYTRLFYSAQVLTTGNLYVAGGEYGTGKNFAELYNFTANSWSVIPEPAGTVYSDAISIMLPNGNILQGTTGKSCYIYDVASNNITGTSGVGQPAHQQNEASWARLPNDNILTVDNYSTNSEHYVPSLNAWYTDNSTPVDLFGYGAETGAMFVLPNGKAFQIGGTSHTCTYTPGSALTDAGTWVQTADIPNSLGAVDAPACMLNNGKILCALGVNTGFGSATNFYEYDYTNDSFTAVNGPTGGSSYGSAEFALDMVQLPNGGVFLIGGQGSTNCYIYFPDGSPIAQGTPTVSSYVLNSDGSYTLTGVGLCGISAGAAYGDDWQNASNYPIVRLTNSAGKVYYCRTTNWSSSAIQNPDPVTVKFTLPSGLPSGTYTLQAVANGNASGGTVFTTGGTTGSAFFEGEALTVNSNTDTQGNSSDASLSGDAGNFLYATGTSSQITYLLPNVASGTYTVKVGMKKWTPRGIFQLSASRADQNTWTNIGSTVDEYNATASYTNVSVGTWTPSTTNDKLFKFQVTGKNASSTSYQLSVDYIQLIRQ